MVEFRIRYKKQFKFYMVSKETEIHCPVNSISLLPFMVLG
nr:MAG TPA: hypothetical protein [Caudoviricetes sp.]